MIFFLIIPYPVHPFLAMLSLIYLWYGSVELHGGLLGYMVVSVGLHSGEYGVT